MAKRIIDWTVTEAGVLNLNKYNADKEAEVQTEKSFDLNLIYPDFLKYNDLQKQLIIYGTKQKLADSGASEKELAGKVTCATEKWERFLKGEFTSKRANSTGVAEAKKVDKKVKETVKLVTLEGLMLKNFMYPDTMTEDDHKKLSEFMAIKVANDAEEAEKAETKKKKSNK